MARSSSLWISSVPQMKRTDAVPAPHFSCALIPAWVTRSSPARPR